MVLSQTNHLLAAVTCSLFISPTAGAAIDYSILNNCKLIEDFSRNIASEQLSTVCREPESDIEFEIYDKTGRQNSPVCFLESPPVSELEGFSCMLSSPEEINSVTCLRSASAEDIEDYKSNYENGPQQKTYDYLEEAAACSISNGGATFASATLLPPPAMIISKYEFGFISPIGKGIETDSFITHGYSTTGSDEIPDAIEYVSILMNANFPTHENREILKLGEWEIEVDRDGFNEKLNEWLANQSVPAQSKSLIFSISNTGTATRTMSQKKAGLSQISHKLIKKFNNENFSVVPDSSIPEATRDALSEIFDKAIPLGFQGIPFGKFDKNFKILINETRPGCTNNNNGAMAAYAMVQHPRPNIKSEYGNIIFTVVGMGKCADFSRFTTERYVDGLLDIATNTIKANYEPD